MTRALCVACVVSAAVASAAEVRTLPKGAEGKLGEDFAKASSVEKLAMIAIASSDGVLADKESKEAINAVAIAEVLKGDTPEARLKLLGTLRRDGRARVESLNKERKAANSKGVRFEEVVSGVQLALAMAYVADQAGERPTLEGLSCLKLVRECTGWGATGQFGLILLQDALARDEAFQKADWPKKASIVTDLHARGLVGELERSELEKTAVLVPWVLAEWKAGRPVEPLGDVWRQLYRDKKLSVHSSDMFFAPARLGEVGKR